MVRTVHSVPSARLLSLILLALWLSGCYSPAIRLNQRHSSTESATGPSVSDLVDQTYDLNTNLPTELGPADDKSASIKAAADTNARNAEHNGRWRQLVEKNFVASIDLTLMVTRADGFNPSLSYVWPLTGAGNRIAKPIYSGTGQTSATYNDTLALGLQLSSTADRNVEQDFMIDMRSLVMQFYQQGNTDTAADRSYEAAHPSHDIAASRFPYCLASAENGRRVRFPKEAPSRAFSGSSLQGNMALFEMIEDGSLAIDRTAPYNIYGTSGPTHLGDVMQQPHGGVGIEALGGGQGAGGAPVAAGKTSFGSKVDFFITTGINGGPSIATLNYKAGGGSSGGSGGGGGGAGGGASGSGAGGGGSGGQLLSYTRTTQDSLTATFGATCAEPLKELAGAASIRVPSFGLRGTTAKADKIVKFAQDVRPAGWSPGMSLKGPNLSDTSSIVKILQNGTVVELSEPAKYNGESLMEPPSRDPTIVEFAVDVPLEGATKQCSDIVLFPVDVRDHDWYAQGAVYSPSVPGGTRIASISADGRVVRLSKPATETGRTHLFERVDYRMAITLPHSLAKQAPEFRAGVFSTSDQKSGDTVTISGSAGQVAVGTIRGMGYVLDTGEFTLRLNVSSGLTGQVVGQIWLKGNGTHYSAQTDAQASITHLPPRLIANLNDDTPTANYWQSVPPCDVATAQQKQNTIDAIATQTQFQTFFRP